MATPKKPNSPPPRNQEPPKKKPVTEFDFNEYEKLKVLYKNISLLKDCLKDGIEKVKDIDESQLTNYEELTKLINFLTNVFWGIVNYTKVSSDKTGLVSLYKSICDQLVERLNGLYSDYNNRYNILRAKLDDMEEQKKAYIDFQIRGMNEVKNDPDWKQCHDGEFFDILRKVFGCVPKGKAIIIDSDGEWFH